MAKVLKVAVLSGILLGIFMNLDDIARYIRISRM